MPVVHTRLRLRMSAPVVSVCLVAAFAASAKPLARGQEVGPALEAALAAFWRAPDPGAAAAATGAILAAGSDFQTIHARLKAGRSYRSGLIGDLSGRPLFFTPAATVSRARRDTRGLWHPYLVVVPRTYDAAKPYPVRFYLQGDTTQPASSAESGVRWLNYEALAREDAIVVFPGAWNGFPWWGATQVEHMGALLDELKRSYNVDENRVSLLGSSDGGTAIYYHAMLATTPWATFLPFNSDPAVLSYPEAGVDAQLYPSNLAGKPLFIVHGGRDQIYPAAEVSSWLSMFEKAGANVTLRLKAQHGHETRWWDEESPAMDAFIASHPRNPLPDAISWETAYTDAANRAHWVIVDELGASPGEALPPAVHLVTPTRPGFGVGTWREVERAGVQLLMVQPGSIVEASGLRTGDIIQQIDDLPISVFSQVDEALGSRAGRVVDIVILRGGQRLTQRASLPDVLDTAPHEAFPHPKPSGRVDLDRRGNTIQVRTRGVRRYTLLLSPEQFDFTKPIVVVTNGATSFEGVVEPSAAVLLKWAARDNDRTMLFGQELSINVVAERGRP